RLVISQMRGESYTLPEVKENYGGLMMTLSKQEHPDMASYDAPEVVWRAQKAYHAGLIVVSPDYERVQELLVSYNQRFLEDFTAVAPPMGTQRTGSTD
ncbi:MAG: ATPase, partial [Chloroflexota bacterium]